MFGETRIGWDERTPRNETVDDDGRPSPGDPGFAVPDPTAPRRRAYDDPGVVDLRRRLRQHNGIHGLEVCSPPEVDRAARIFSRDGFVVVRDLLDAEQLRRFRSGCSRVLGQILEARADGRRHQTESWRLPHRYSYGTCSASRQMLHEPDWAAVIDLPTTTPILTRIFGSPDYLVAGAGGDLCLPGAIEYPHLHADFRDAQRPSEGRVELARALGIETGDLDLRTQRLIMERTPPVVTINFPMSDLTWENGPIRHIPMSHTVQQSPPPPAREPEWMRRSTLVGAPAGAGVFRDNRAWHGATPNLSREVRALPNIEYVAPWLGGPGLGQTLPHDVWETLSPHARRICRFVVAEPGVRPPGAGFVHPLAAKRRESFWPAQGGEGPPPTGAPGRYPGADHARPWKQ